MSLIPVFIVEDMDMNKDALKTFNKAAQGIKTLETRLTNAKTLRSKRETIHAERQRKLIQKYDNMKARALVTLTYKATEDLKKSDAVLKGAQDVLNIQRKRLVDLAKQVGETATPPKETPRETVPAFSDQR